MNIPKDKRDPLIMKTLKEKQDMLRMHMKGKVCTKKNFVRKQQQNKRAKLAINNTLFLYSCRLKEKKYNNNHELSVLDI